MTADALAPPLRAKPTLTRVIIAASLGNALEWFDFLVYGYMMFTAALSIIALVFVRRRRYPRLHAGLDVAPVNC